MRSSNNKSSSLNVGLVSLDQKWLDKDSNFLRCVELSKIAVAEGCDLLVFPEMTLTGYSMDVTQTVELCDTSDTLKYFGELAKTTELKIIFGACLVKSEDALPHNFLCFSDSDGNTTPIYSKVHPFTYAGEETVFEAGNALGYLQLANSKFGCSVCYDIRFPELFSAMASNVDAIVCIASWPARRISHWRTLLAARAIENQLFMIGVNRTGVDGNGIEFEKSSMIAAPTGEVLCPTYESAELDIYEIDLNDTCQYRDKFPTLCDKRYSLYKGL